MPEGSELSKIICSHMDRLHERRHRIHKAAGAEHTPDFRNARLRIGYVFQHRDSHREVEAPVGKRQIMSVGDRLNVRPESTSVQTTVAWG